MPGPDGGADGGPFVASGPFLAAGAKHTCLTFGEGAVRCWGDNEFGQLGRPPVGDPLEAYSVDLGIGRRATGVYAGQYHTCVTLEGGAIKCWGDNSFGHLGVGDMLNRGDGLSAMGDALPTVDLGTGERVVSLALGGTASCALLENGRVKCWGDPYQGATGNGDGELRGASPVTMGDNLPVVDLGSRDGVPFKVKLLEAFEYHSFCAILDDRDPNTSGLKCWGSNDYCELGIGQHEGGRGLEVGSLGNNLPWIDIGTTASGSVRKAVAMAIAFQSICVLGDDGIVKCWGTNRFGELGLGNTSDPRSCSLEEMGNAGLVALPERAVSVAARYERACAILASGAVTCWGTNMYGQLGVGDTTPRLAPSAPLVFEDGFRPERLVLGDDHSCAISADKRVKCWGSNQRGQLGAAVGAGEPPGMADPSVPNRLAPGPDLRLRSAPVDVLAAGGDHTCAVLSSGALKCWGRNGDGQLGLGDTTNRGAAPGQMGDALAAVDLGAGGAARAVAAGAAHTCAVLADGAVRCWGAGIAGQLGQGQAVSALAPAAAVTLPGATTAVAAGSDFSCALLADGRVFCWGAAARGQLGTGDTANVAAPGAPVALPDNAIAVAAGSGHACARLAGGRLACWGANEAGQLGVGDNEDRARPVVVGLGAGQVAEVATRLDSTCVRLDDGSVKCWGRNTRGQLGLGDSRDRTAPAGVVVDLGRGRRASALAVGGAFACALLDTDQPKCWGDNRAYELGAPLRAPAYGDEPNEMGDVLAAAVQGGGRSVRAIAAGRGHACAILDTRDVRCWGDNAHGQLGIGDADSHSPFLRPSGAVDLGEP